MAAPDIAELGLSVRSDGVVVATDRLDRMEGQARKTEKASERLAKKTERLASSMGQLGRNMTVGLTLPMAAASAASIKLAIDAEEAANKFDVVFRGSVQESRKELQRLTRTIPLTRTQMEEMAAGIQDMLVPMGVARAEAAGMSVDMVKLAGDLASFNNTGTENVLMAMQSALAGSSEPMRRFGVDTRETRLQQLALEEGIIGVNEELNNSTRAQAVLRAIMEDSTDAMGDAERTMDAAANQIRFLQRDVRQLSEDLGKELIPIFREGLASVREWVTWFKSLDVEQQRQIAQYAAMTAALGPLLLVFSGLLKIFANIVRIAPAVKGALIAIATPIGGVLSAAVIATSAAIIEMNRRFGEIESIAPSAAQAIDAAFTALETGAEDAQQKVSAALDQISQDLAEARALVDIVEAQRPDNDFLRAITDPYGAMARAAEVAETKVRNLEQAQAELAVSSGRDIFSRMEDGAARLARALGLVADESEKAAGAGDEVSAAWDKATAEGEKLVDQLTEELALWGKNEAETLRYEAALAELNDTYGDASDEVAKLLRGKADLIEAENDAAEAADREAESQDRLNQRLRDQQALLDRLNPQQARMRQFNQETLTLLNATSGAGSGRAGVGDFIGGVQLFGEFVSLFAKLTEELEEDFSGRRGRSAFGEDGVLINTGRSDAAGGGGAEALLMEGLARAQQQAASILLQEFGGSGPGAQIGEAFGSAFGLIPQIAGNLIGDFIDDLFGSGAPDFPTFNIQQSQPSLSGLDQSRDTVFGGVASGNVFNVDANQIQEILDAIAKFDRQLAQTFDPSDFDAISAALANFDETFEDSAANAEEVMRRRFIAALNAAEPEIAAFVESFGDLQSMQAALAGIESIRDSLDDFSNVLLAMGGPADQVTSRLNRMQQGIEAADTAMEQALFSEDPQAIAQAGQDLQRAIIEKFELEKQLIRNLQSQLRELELSSRDFAVSMAERIADVGGPRDLSGLVQTTIANRQAARQDVLNADDTQQALRDLDRFVAATDEWLDAARRRVTELRDMELERIQGQIQTLETEAQEILGRGRERAQQQAQAAQRASQAAAQARQAELDAINEQLEQAREWQSVLDSTRQMIDNLTFSQTNPASRFSRLGMLNDRIQGQDVSTPEGARELQQLLQRRLDLGQQLFQRGSPEFESLFNNTMRRLSEIEDKAKSEAQIANDLQRQANELQSQTTGSVSAGTQQQIILSREEQRRLEEIRAEQAALEEEAQQVREDAEAALQRIDEQARKYYEWARNKREKLEEKRHGEIVSELEAITGGMDPDSYIAMRQAEVVDRLTSIRDMMANFLESIQGQSSGAGGGGGSGPPGDGPGPGPGPNPSIGQSGGEKVVRVILDGKGSCLSGKDIRRLATVIERERKTA